MSRSRNYSGMLRESISDGNVSSVSKENQISFLFSSFDDIRRRSNSKGLVSPTGDVSVTIGDIFLKISKNRTLEFEVFLTSGKLDPYPSQDQVVVTFRESSNHERFFHVYNMRRGINIVGGRKNIVESSKEGEQRGQVISISRLKVKDSKNITSVIKLRVPFPVYHQMDGFVDVSVHLINFRYYGKGVFEKAIRLKNKGVSPSGRVRKSSNRRRKSSQSSPNAPPNKEEEAAEAVIKKVFVSKIKPNLGRINRECEEEPVEIYCEICPALLDFTPELMSDKIFVLFGRKNLGHVISVVPWIKHIPPETEEEKKKSQRKRKDDDIDDLSDSDEENNNNNDKVTYNNATSILIYVIPPKSTKGGFVDVILRIGDCEDTKKKGYRYFGEEEDDGDPFSSAKFMSEGEIVDSDFFAQKEEKEEEEEEETKKKDGEEDDHSSSLDFSFRRSGSDSYEDLNDSIRNTGFRGIIRKDVFGRSIFHYLSYFHGTDIIPRLKILCESSKWNSSPDDESIHEDQLRRVRNSQRPDTPLTRRKRLAKGEFDLFSCVNERDHFGFLPIDLARHFGRVEVVEYLTVLYQQLDPKQNDLMSALRRKNSFLNDDNGEEQDEVRKKEIMKIQLEQQEREKNMFKIIRSKEIGGIFDDNNRYDIRMHTLRKDIAGENCTNHSIHFEQCAIKAIESGDITRLRKIFLFLSSSSSPTPSKKKSKKKKKTKTKKKKKMEEDMIIKRISFGSTTSSSSMTSSLMSNNKTRSLITRHGENIITDGIFSNFQYNSMLLTHYATVHQKLGILRYLIENKDFPIGEKVEMIDVKSNVCSFRTKMKRSRFIHVVNGDTILHIASRTGNVEIVKYLLSRVESLDVLTIKNKFGQRPFEVVPARAKTRRGEELTNLMIRNKYLRLMVRTRRSFTKEKLRELEETIGHLRKENEVLETIGSIGQKLEACHFEEQFGGGLRPPPILSQEEEEEDRSKSTYSDEVLGRAAHDGSSLDEIQRLVSLRGEVVNDDRYRKLYRGFRSSSSSEYSPSPSEFQNFFEKMKDHEEKRERGKATIKYKYLNRISEEVLDARKTYVEINNQNLESVRLEMMGKQFNNNNNHNPAVKKRKAPKSRKKSNEDKFLPFYRKKREIEELKEEVLKIPFCFEDYRDEALDQINEDMKSLNALTSVDSLSSSERCTEVIQYSEYERRLLVVHRGLKDYIDPKIVPNEEDKNFLQLQCKGLKGGWGEDEEGERKTILFVVNDHMFKVDDQVMRIRKFIASRQEQGEVRCVMKFVFLKDVYVGIEILSQEE